MPARTAVVAGICAVLLVGCTGWQGTPDASPRSSDDASAFPRGTTTATPERAPRGPSPPTPVASDGPALREEVLLGTGTLTVDGTEVAVSGDCAISREFGERPVGALTDEVEVLLAVDNLTGDGGHDGPFAIQVRLLGRGELVGRTLVSEGAPASEPGDTLFTTYTGEVEVAELQDRRERDFVDVARLHLEASQRRTRGEQGPRRRELTVDVACPISRPAR